MLLRFPTREETTAKLLQEYKVKVHLERNSRRFVLFPQRFYSGTAMLALFAGLLLLTLTAFGKHFHSFAVS